MKPADGEAPVPWSAIHEIVRHLRDAGYDDGFLGWVEMDAIPLPPGSRRVGLPGNDNEEGRDP